MSVYLFQLHYVSISDWVITGNVNHRLNKPTLINAKDVKPMDIIFSNTNLLSYEKLSSLLLQIQVPYILITAICDETVPYLYDCSEKPKYDYRPLLECKNLVAWFGTNVDLEHPKIHPIPLGIPFSKPVHSDTHPAFKSAHCKYMGWYSDLFDIAVVIDKYNSMPLEEIKDRFMSPKKELLFCGYTTMNTDDCTVQRYRKIRSELDKYLETTKFVKSDLTSWERYTERLGSSKFTLSPPGRGIDTHRTYEALICGSIPIVFPAYLNKLYEGLPVLVVDDFKKLTPEYLDTEYKELMSRGDYDFTKLTSDYWCKKILDMKSVYRILPKSPLL
jgi:hypothetical protein